LIYITNFKIWNLKMKKTTLAIITIATLISGCGDPAAERAAADAKKAAVEAERSLSEIKQAVLASLKDPESAKFGQFTQVGDNQACIEVNARNSYGGYSGTTPFLVRKIDGEWNIHPLLKLSYKTCLAMMKARSEEES
jgi:hypothetical protein